MWIVEMLSTGGFSAILGGIMGIATKWQEQKILDSKQNHAVAMLNAQTDSALRLAEAEIEGDRVKGQLAVDKQDAKSFTESQKSTVIGDAIKSAIRPIITVALMYMVWDIYVKMDIIVGGIEGLPSQDVFDLHRTIILQVIALSGVCIGWWFGNRNSKGYDKVIGKL